MGKGQAAVLLIIVAIVAAAIFLFPQAIRPPSVTEPVRYKNDIITLENFEVSNLRPVKGSIVTVSFDATNNGDKEVKDVRIDFSGTTMGSGDDVTIVEYEGCLPLTEVKAKSIIGIPIPFTSEVAKKFCVFDKIDSLDSRKVTVNYRVVNDGTRNIVAKVTYQHTGTREALIPIIDDKTVKVPKSKFSQSQPSFGPFVVDIIPPTKGWAISNLPFEIKFKLRFVGSSAVGTPIPSIDEFKIYKNSFRAMLTELQVADLGGEPSCQFQQATIGNVAYHMVNVDRELEVNKEYSCYLEASSITDTFGYKTGTIKILFWYNFGFQKSQSIVVVETP